MPYHNIRDGPPLIKALALDKQPAELDLYDIPQYLVAVIRDTWSQARLRPSMEECSLRLKLGRFFGGHIRKTAFEDPFVVEGPLADLGQLGTKFPSYVHLLQGDCLGFISPALDGGPRSYELNAVTLPFPRCSSVYSISQNGNVLYTRYGVDRMLYQMRDKIAFPYVVVIVPSLVPADGVFSDAVSNRYLEWWFSVAMAC